MRPIELKGLDPNERPDPTVAKSIARELPEGTTFDDIENVEVVGAHPKYVPALRREIHRVRWLINPASCPEAAEFLASFKDQFVRWKDGVLPAFGVTEANGQPRGGDAALPSLDRLFTAFSPDE